MRGARLPGGRPGGAAAHLSPLRPPAPAKGTVADCPPYDTSRVRTVLMSIPLPMADRSGVLLLKVAGVQLAITSHDARNKMIDDFKNKLLDFVLNVLPKIEVPPLGGERDLIRNFGCTSATEK